MFKKDFLFGFSLSGFQSEMGSGEIDANSDWWKWVNDPDNIRSGLVSGDLPSDGIGYWEHYEKYNEKAAEIGLNACRLGIEWTRLFPKATEDVLVNVEKDGEQIVNVDISDAAIEKLDKIANKNGVNRYTKIFQNIKENGMKLIINAYHWPLPLVLHDPIKSRSSGLSNEDNGWLNHRSIIEFTKYAAYISYKFGDMVERFSIMNEPNVVSGEGYIDVKSGFPPSFPSISAANKAKLHLVESIARAYDAMKLYTKKPVGFIYANTDFQPLGIEDKEAAEKAKYNDRYSFIDPLYNGDMAWFVNRNKVGELSEKINPIRDDLKGRADWIGVNYYTRTVIKKIGENYTALRGYGHGATAGLPSADNLEVSDFGWEVYPRGLYNVLKEYQARYHLPMIVTENGIADSLDRYRSRYLVSHIDQVEKAISDGADVRGYLHWSLYDNYEWSSGFKMKFGLFGVDPKTKALEMRPSALVYQKIARNGGIPDEFRWMCVQ